MRAVFLDIETTGLDPQRHRVLDIAFCIVDLTGQAKNKSYRAAIRQSQAAWDERDPGSTEINGFTFAEVDSGQDIASVQQEIKAIFAGHGIERGKAFYICQNPAFDRSFFAQLVSIATQESLQWPYHWLDLASMYFALTVRKSLDSGIAFPENLTLSKNKIAESFHLPPEGQPHKAAGGVRHLIECYEALFGIHFKEEE